MLTITTGEAAALAGTPAPGAVKRMVADRDVEVPIISATSDAATPVLSYDVCHRKLVTGAGYATGSENAPTLPTVSCIFPRGMSKAAAAAALDAVKTAVNASGLFS